MNTKDHAVSGNVSTERALDLALEALERLDGWLALRYGSGLTPQEQQVVTAIKQAKKSNIKQVIHLYDEPPAAPVQQKPLFADIIAQHPGLAEELRALSEGFELGYKAGLATAQPALKPLTDEQAQDIVERESWGPEALTLNYQLLRTIRRTEAAHGITEKGKP
jgi:hypothetical protein